MRDYLDQRDERQQLAGSNREGVESGGGPSFAEGTPLSAQRVLHLQRSVGNASTAAYLASQEEADSAGTSAGRSPIHDTIASGGSPLEASTRSTMEQHFGEDFSDVRLHVDARSAESVQAAAYTVGNDIVVHPNHYSPGSPSAQRTLAHELTHVVQQRSGPVDGTEAAGGIRLSDPGDRFEREAEQRAETVVSSSQAPAAPGRLSAGDARGEAVQRLTIQREMEGDEEENEEGAP